MPFSLYNPIWEWLYLFWPIQLFTTLKKRNISYHCPQHGSQRSLKFSPLISLSWKVFIKRKSLHFEMKLQARTLINSGVLAWSEPPHHNSKSVLMKFPHIDSSHWKPNKSTIYSIVLENGALTLALLHQYLWDLISEIIVLLHNRQILYFCH